MAGESYIGSVISLISLSEIRYVGTLHSINAKDATVGLKQVRSFGTEGRRGKLEEEIYPSDNVFDYVVFRGSDIKDLQVFETPKPTFPQVHIPQDPAIMSMGYTTQPPVVYPVYDTLDKTELDPPTIDEAAIEQLAKRVSELNPNEEKKTRRRGNNRFNNKKAMIPNVEFDFEASNAKFEKSQVEEKIDVPEFYDKKSSFFDNISCESKERIEQQNEPRRHRFQEERKLNMETFGQATVDQSRYHRGRGHGYRHHRGGYHRNHERQHKSQQQEDQ